MRRLEARGEIGELNTALADEVAALFGEPATLAVRERPSVVLVVGVNGTGKTMTIGKLAERLRKHGHAVVLGAADTFRAAVEEQLEIWAERAGAALVGAEHGADPASVAYEAIKTAASDGRDVVIVDAAGRLHTQANLMEELAKVRRVDASEVMRQRAHAAGNAGVGKSGPVLPTTAWQLRTIDEPGADEAYTLAYRALSADIHAGAPAFIRGQLERHGDGTASYRDDVGPEDILPARALALTIFASTLAVASDALALGIEAAVDEIKHRFVAPAQ